MNYPEIEALELMIAQHAMHFHQSSPLSSSLPRSFFMVAFRLAQSEYQLLIEDEYQDWDAQKPAMCLCLLLLSLEEYEETEDFLDWCKTLDLDASHPLLREYHMSLRTIVPEIRAILGGIDSPISHFDLEMNAGAAYWLRQRGEKA